MRPFGKLSSAGRSLLVITLACVAIGSSLLIAHRSPLFTASAIASSNINVRSCTTSTSSIDGAYVQFLEKTTCPAIFQGWQYATEYCSQFFPAGLQGTEGTFLSHCFNATATSSSPTHFPSNCTNCSLLSFACAPNAVQPLVNLLVHQEDCASCTNGTCTIVQGAHVAMTHSIIPSATKPPSKGKAYYDLVLHVHNNGSDPTVVMHADYTLKNSQGASAVFGTTQGCTGNANKLTITCPSAGTGLTLSPGYSGTWKYELEVTNASITCPNTLTFNYALNTANGGTGTFTDSIPCSNSPSTSTNHYSYEDSSLRADLDLPLSPPAPDQIFQEAVTVTNEGDTPQQHVFVDAYMGADETMTFDAGTLPSSCQLLNDRQVRCAAGGDFANGFTLAAGQSQIFIIPIHLPPDTQCGAHANALWINAHTTSNSTPVVGSLNVLCPVSSENSLSSVMCLPHLCASFCIPDDSGKLFCKEICANFPSNPFEHLCTPPSVLQTFHCTFSSPPSCTYTCQ